MSDPIGALAGPDMLPVVEPVLPVVEPVLPAMPVASLALPEVIGGVVEVLDEVDGVVVVVVEVELSIGALAPALVGAELLRPQPVNAASARAPVAARVKSEDVRVVVMDSSLDLDVIDNAMRRECDGGRLRSGVSRHPVST